VRPRADDDDMVLEVVRSMERHAASLAAWPPSWPTLKRELDA
jgi:hypothetical protein